MRVKKLPKIKQIFDKYILTTDNSLWVKIEKKSMWLLINTSKEVKVDLTLIDKNICIIFDLLSAEELIEFLEINQSISYDTKYIHLHLNITENELFEILEDLEITNFYIDA